MSKPALTLCILAFLTFPFAAAGTCPLKFDRTVHDFGVISLKDGPVSCEFTVTNVSAEPAVIYAVTTSCGCTVAEWTREAIGPGKTGRITVSYSNDEGPYPFDKTLNVYIKDNQKPVMLHIRGKAVKKK